MEYVLLHRGSSGGIHFWSNTPSSSTLCQYDGKHGRSEEYIEIWTFHEDVVKAYLGLHCVEKLCAELRKDREEMETESKHISYRDPEIERDCVMCDGTIEDTSVSFETEDGDHIWCHESCKSHMADKIGNVWNNADKILPEVL